MELLQVLDERLANAGDTIVVKGKLNEESYRLGEHQFMLPEGIDYDLVLTNAGDGILATGTVEAAVNSQCDRCLNDANFELQSELEEYYLFKDPELDPSYKAEDDDIDYSLVRSDNLIDLGEAIEAALLMETPFVVLCQEDCKGLCPVCGENLNEHDCGHLEQLAQQEEQDKLNNSPFAKLKDLHFE